MNSKNCWKIVLGWHSWTSMLPSYSWWTRCLLALKRSVCALWARTGRIQQPNKANRWSYIQLTRRSGSGQQALQSASMSFVLASYYEYYKESTHLLMSCSSSLRHTETTYKYDSNWIKLQQECSDLQQICMNHFDCEFFPGLKFLICDKTHCDGTKRIRCLFPALTESTLVNLPFSLT